MTSRLRISAGLTFCPTFSLVYATPLLQHQAHFGLTPALLRITVISYALTPRLQSMADTLISHGGRSGVTRNLEPLKNIQVEPSLPFPCPLFSPSDLSQFPSPYPPFPSLPRDARPPNAFSAIHSPESANLLKVSPTCTHFCLELWGPALLGPLDIAHPIATQLGGR